MYPTPWQKLHFRGIESAYKNSPYYEYYIDDLMPFFEKQETYLFDHNLAILTTILDFLKLKRDIRLTTDYIPKPYRQTFSDRFPFTPNLSILDLLFCCGPEAGEMI